MKTLTTTPQTQDTKKLFFAIALSFDIFVAILYFTNNIQLLGWL